MPHPYLIMFSEELKLWVSHCTVSSIILFSSSVLGPNIQLSSLPSIILSLYAIFTSSDTRNESLDSSASNNIQVAKKAPCDVKLNMFQDLFPLLGDHTV
jgi:hypothetical protein